MPFDLSAIDFSTNSIEIGDRYVVRLFLNKIRSIQKDGALEFLTKYRDKGNQIICVFADISKKAYVEIVSKYRYFFFIIIIIILLLF